MCISNVTKIKNIQNIQVMANQNKTDIGLIGLAVMGENLALNMESKGWHVSVYNRTVPGVEEGVVERFLNGRAKGKNIEGFTDIKAFVDSIAIPRKIMMMVRAGSPVDELMDQLFPLLSPGDILIDGGNSNYEDTNRRVQLAESKGFLFVGSGVSGGEEGALNGASIMPGGSEKAWPEVKPILQSIAAKAPDGTPCCQWVGPAGSGHFVKMIHNGIEYGDMQLIAEAYWVMKKLLDLTNEEMADVFARWNEGKLRSYLIEITANILRHKDKSGGYLIDKILDAAGQKGTGKWSVINAMELGMPLGLIATAVFERSLSSQKDLRHLASKQFQCQHTQPIYNKAELVKNIFSALYASKLVSYAQGFAVLQRASDAFGWHLDLASIARMSGGHYTIMGDRIVAATLLAAGAAAGGSVRLKGVDWRHVATVSAVLMEAGCGVYSDGQGVPLHRDPARPLRGVSTIRTAPYPGFPTDAQAPVMAALAAGQGTTMFVENMFDSRYRHVSELARMGADITVEGRVALVRGVRRLHGARVEATDLRGGGALAVAALGAEGETVITGVHHIDRGYAGLEDMVRRLGGTMKRREDTDEAKGA